MKREEWFPVPSEDETHLIAHLFQPEALTLARELRGLTKADLAQLIYKTPGAVSQFEAGTSRPDVKTIKAMGLALGLPLNFFARTLSSSIAPLDSCHFRSLRSATQRERRRVLARGTLIRNAVEVVEEYVELPPEKVSSVASVVCSNDEIEGVAQEVRKSWGLGIGPIPDLIRLLESNGIIVSFVPVDCEQVDAFSCWQNGRPYIYLLPGKESTSRTRFDCAHELGHLVMHVDVLPGDKTLEAQANRFASAFLMPREAFIRECPRRINWDHFFELKKRWRVSVAAIVRRAYDLECISEATYRRACMQLSQKGYRTSEPMEPAPEAPSLLRQSLAALQGDLDFNSLASQLCVRAQDVSSVLGMDEGL